MNPDQTLKNMREDLMMKQRTDVPSPLDTLPVRRAA